MHVAQGPAVWIDLLLRRFVPGRSLPAPDLLVGAGHATHLPMLSARRSHGGKIIVLMRPSLPANWFDLCLIPRHDQIVASDNVLLTQGALNSVSCAGTKDPRSGLILIGGPSKHYLWDESRLQIQIRQIVGTGPAIQWSMTDSPRTPDSTRQLLQALRHENLEYVPAADTPRDWVTHRLMTAANVWVSADSMSMIYEALTSGAAVGLLEVPAKANSRLVSAVTVMIKDGLVTPYENWLAGTMLKPPAIVLNESARAARYILDRFKLSLSGP